jgi:hypothetical protein
MLRALYLLILLFQQVKIHPFPVNQFGANALN